MNSKVVCPNCKKKHTLGTTWCGTCGSDIDECKDRVIRNFRGKRKTSKPRIFIYVSGGLIQNIVADQKVEVMVLDADVDGMEGGKTFKDAINGSTFEAREDWDHTDVEVSKKIVDHYFRQRS